MEWWMFFEQLYQFISLNFISYLEILTKYHVVCNGHHFYFFLNLIKCRIFAYWITNFTIKVKNMSKIIITAAYVTPKSLPSFSTQTIKFRITNTLQTFCWLIALIWWSLYVRSRYTDFFIINLIILLIRFNLIHFINLLKFLIYFDFMRFTNFLVCGNWTFFINRPMYRCSLLLDNLLYRLMLNLWSFNRYNLLWRKGIRLFFKFFLFFLNIWGCSNIFDINSFYLFTLFTHVILFILFYFYYFLLKFNSLCIIIDINFSFRLCLGYWWFAFPCRCYLYLYSIIQWINWLSLMIDYIGFFFFFHFRIEYD